MVRQEHLDMLGSISLPYDKFKNKNHSHESAFSFLSISSLQFFSWDKYQPDSFVTWRKIKINRLKAKFTFNQRG